MCLIPYRKIEQGRIEPNNPPTDEDLANQAKEFNQLWEEFELLKMDVAPGSKWYLVSAQWLKSFKEYVSQPEMGGDARMDVEHPGMILNTDILDMSGNILIDPHSPHLNYNLKENLIEETHYFIVNQKVWDFLYSHYGGIEA